MSKLKYSKHASRHRVPRRLLFVLVGLLVLLAAATVTVRHEYYENLAAVSSSEQTSIVTVPSGSSVKQIATILHTKHLIRATWAFEWYVHSKELGANLQAGTYAIAPSQDLQSIVSTLTKGKVTTKLVTILPGRRIDQVRADLINDGFSVAAVDTALQPAQYVDLPVLSYKPSSDTTLEGLLYPDSFERTATTDPSVIIRESLVEMGQHLTPDLQAAYATEGLSTYQAITLASLVEQEVSNQSDRNQVAQVFLTRLKMNIPLGSDVTANYGAIIAGKSPSLTYDSPYNTELHTGLPPGPVSSVSSSSLQAVAHPANTSWLYFVAGDDGTTHFEQPSSSIKLILPSIVTSYALFNSQLTGVGVGLAFYAISVKLMKCHVNHNNDATPVTF